MRGAQGRARDERINARYPIWLEYLVMLVVMLCLTGGQALIFSSYVKSSDIVVPPEFILANAGYWALMTLPVTWVMLSRRRRTLDKPMHTLSDAARKVAGGDFSVHIPPIRKDGKRDYVEVMFDDFNTMVDELASTEMLTNDFVSNVSHEIKTPLSVIQSYAMALQKPGLSPEEEKEYTDTIISASGKLNTLVTDILRLGKLENLKIAPVAEEFDLCRQLCESALSFESLMEDKGIAFSADIEEKALVCADQSLLEIVWNNLLSNALKFTDPGGTVTLAQASGEGVTTVTITDTGCGIGKESINRIFDKFYQGDASHSKEGNGLGLALSKRAVELAGGTIAATSEPGAGSSFSVTLKTAH
ncbi:MAG: HAMP domain-containing histidine kinase [Eggerthellaceae bacterium]|nr:HAMP domain-containing histidine kinase [Eggerthellaceae bacterium]